jgi:hypothetical protein
LPNRGGAITFLKSLVHLGRGPAFVAARASIQSMISQYPPEKLEYICVHNIFTDLLLGIGKPHLFAIVCDAIRSLGYKPAFISLNPLLADRALPEGVDLCIYYNLNGFNMCPGRMEVVEFVRSTDRPLWAMGLLASGAVPITDAFDDAILSRFSRVIYATSNKDRLHQAASLWDQKRFETSQAKDAT